MAARTLVSSAGDLPSATRLDGVDQGAGPLVARRGVGLGVAAAAGDVLADIGQHRVAGQGPGQEDGLVAGEVGEQPVQAHGLAVGGLLRSGRAGRGDQLGGILAVEIGDRLVQQVAEQARVLSHVAAGGAIAVGETSRDRGLQACAKLRDRRETATAHQERNVRNAGRTLCPCRRSGALTALCRPRKGGRRNGYGTKFTFAQISASSAPASRHRRAR
jgi:hypothetical protein